VEGKTSNGNYRQCSDSDKQQVGIFSRVTTQITPGKPSSHKKSQIGQRVYRLREECIAGAFAIDVDRSAERKV
jgi:hypothetical protein